MRIKGTRLSGSGPEERRFELLDESLKTIGHISFDVYEELTQAVATTPWGRFDLTTQGGIFRNGRRGSLSISREGQVVSVLEPHLLRLDFNFPGRAVMPFKIRPGHFVLKFEGETGSVGVSVEEGTTAGTGGFGAHDRALKEVKALPKENRPNSVEDPSYSQFAITVSGILPVNEDDVIQSLIMEECLSALDFENLNG
jgi:hypothetical protein